MFQFFKKNNKNKVDNDIIINSNNEHTVVHLPISILKHIIGYINDNIDRLCFSLVCLRWYKERSKYLHFNPNTLLVSEGENSVHTMKDELYLKKLQPFKAFKEIYKSSLAQKDTNGYSVSIDCGYRESLCIGYSFDYRFNILDTPIDQIQEFILGRYITTLHYSGCARNEPYFYPPNVKNVIIEFGLNFDPKILPPTVERLTVSGYDKEFEAGDLPDSLLYLKLTIDRNVHSIPPLNADVLPRGLKHININSYGEIIVDNEHSLPCNLVSLRVLRINFIPYIKEMSQLRKLTLMFPATLQYTIKAGDIPSSVTSLSLTVFNFEHFNPEIIPSSVTMLTVTFLWKHNDPISVSKILLPNTDNNNSINNKITNIKKLKIYGHTFNPRTFKCFDFKDIPNGLETLKLTGFHSFTNSDLLLLPNTVNFVYFPNGCIIDATKIPPHIEKIGYRQQTTLKNITEIPSTVRYIKCENSYSTYLPIKTIPNNVQSCQNTKKKDNNEQGILRRWDAKHFIALKGCFNSSSRIEGGFIKASDAPKFIKNCSFPPNMKELVY